MPEGIITLPSGGMPTSSQLWKLCLPPAALVGTWMTGTKAFPAVRWTTDFREIIRSVLVSELLKQESQHLSKETALGSFLIGHSYKSPCST